MKGLEYYYEQEAETKRKNENTKLSELLNPIL